MDRFYDEISKSLAVSVPRRESLRRIGAVLVGAVLSPLGMAWARGPDPCKAFCRCAKGTKQNQCLAACRACSGNTSRLGGSCGSYVCCPTAVCNGQCSNLTSDPNCGACGIDCRDIGETCCETYCADLENDFDNCGSCGFVCPDPGPFEFGECMAGGCHYACVEGTVKCNGVCSSLDFDPDNCGACDHVCPSSAPVCNQGVCICPSGMALCDGECLDILSDPAHCGACGADCPSSAPYCRGGVCSDRQCPPGLTWCQLQCVDLLWNNWNCGACFQQCPSGTVCSFGTCVGSCVGCE